MTFQKKRHNVPIKRINNKEDREWKTDYMDCPIGVLLPDEQDKHMEKESGYGLSGGGATCDNKGGTQMGVS